MNATARLKEKAAPLKGRLLTLRQRARRHILTAGLSVLTATATAMAIVSFVADWTLYLERSTRIALLIAALAALAWITIRRILLPLGVALSDDDLALAVERQHPELHESLINAVQFSEYDFDL